EKPVQAKPEPGGHAADGDGIAARLRANRGGGQPLPPPVLHEMSSAFGHDFGGVRVHTGSDAAELSSDLGAQAFTHGGDIYFSHGKFAPESAQGRHLLAHELTHVVQQGGEAANNLVQRAEVDDRSCSGLTDIETDIDAKVNAEIATARSLAGTPLSL